jgi:hypothetical protein
VGDWSGIGKIKRVALREVWQHEARDFSAWLADNLDALGGALGFKLQNAECEKQVGAFSLDLLAENADGERVIVENQLEKSDHDHLGKLITYLSGLDAKAAVWITPDPRPEHITAVTWLNESANEDFYLVKVEAIRIGDSNAAPLFTLIVGPSEEARAIGQEKREHSEFNARIGRYWRGLLDRYEKVAGRRPDVPIGKSVWQAAGDGNDFGSFWFALRQSDGSAELYIHNLNERGVPNRLYDFFERNRAAIEKAAGKPLAWIPPGRKKYGRILYNCIEKGHLAPEGDWPAMQEKMVEAMIVLKNAVKPFVDEAVTRDDLHDDDPTGHGVAADRP